MKQVLIGVGLVCVAMVAGGCTEAPFHVSVKLDESDPGLKDKIGAVQSIEVNVIAVNDVEFKRWEEMSMNAYWEPDNAVRKSAKKFVMTFGQDHPSRQVLTRQDPIWKNWLDERKATKVLVLAYIPWLRADKPGTADPRRIILPLDPWKYDWSLWPGEEAKTIPILIQSGGLHCLRQPKK